MGIQHDSPPENGHLHASGEGSQDDESPPTILDAQAVRQMHARHQAEQNKENRQPQRSLLDRQANARRVQFGDPSQMTQTSRGIQASSSSEGEPAFQMQQDLARASQSPSQTRKRKRQPSSSTRNVRRTPLQEVSADAVADHPRTEAVANLNPEQAKEVASYEDVNAMAKKNVRDHKKKGEPQQRRAWDEGEIAALTDYIKTYGCSWALIKKMDKGERLQGRGEVALKDKARNMWFDWLKSVPQHNEYLPMLTNRQVGS